MYANLWQAIVLRTWWNKESIQSRHPFTHDFFFINRSKFNPLKVHYYDYSLSHTCSFHVLCLYYLIVFLIPFHLRCTFLFYLDAIQKWNNVICKEENLYENIISHSMFCLSCDVFREKDFQSITIPVVPYSPA